MPIYEYQCSRCGFRLEKLQKISDDPLTQCPKCNESALSKLVSASAFRLKGSGWYETDFKTGAKRNLTGDSGSDSKSGDNTGSTGESSTSPAKEESSSTKKTKSSEGKPESPPASAGSSD